MKRIFAVFVALALASVSAFAQEKPRTIVVGTGISYAPYCYLDKDGRLAGFEKEVLDAVDALLPQYEFKYETFDFSNILLALQGGKIDIGAHEFEENPQRRLNYLYGEQPYNTFTTYITVRRDNTSITRFEDLYGKTVSGDVGDNSTQTIQAWNKKAKKKEKIKLVLTKSVQAEEVVAGIKSGKVDAVFKTAIDIHRINSEYGGILKKVGKPLNSSKAYFLFQKGNTQLQKDIDGAIRQLRESGELSKIALRTIGVDTTEVEFSE